MEDLFVIDKVGDAENLSKKTNDISSPSLPSSSSLPPPSQGKNLSKKQKRKRKRVPATQDEEDLRKNLFGDEEYLEKLGTEEVAKEEESEENVETKEEDLSQKRKKALKPAWQDKDDGKVFVDITPARQKKLRQNIKEKKISGKEYSERLKKQFELRQHQKADWADLNELEKREEEVEIFKTTGPLVGGPSTEIQEGTLEVIRLNDANQKDLSEVPLESIRFHPSSQLLLTAGFDRMLRLFQIDGKFNTKIQSIKFPDMPIFAAEFTPDGKDIIVTGRRRFFYVYNIEEGKATKVESVSGRQEQSLEWFTFAPDNSVMAVLGRSGYVTLLSLKTKQLIGTVKSNNDVRGATFSPDGSLMYTCGRGEDIFVWNVKTRRCVLRFADEGSLCTTALAISPDNRFLVTGSEIGVINVYLISELSMENQRPKPVKTIMNIDTKITRIRFNMDGQLMAVSSRPKKDCLRIIHVPTWTVYSNWPTSRTPLGHVSSFDFSPNSGLLVIGNERGKALLYRLNHYTQS